MGRSADNKDSSRYSRGPVPGSDVDADKASDGGDGAVPKAQIKSTQRAKRVGPEAPNRPIDCDHLERQDRGIPLGSKQARDQVRRRNRQGGGDRTNGATQQPTGLKVGRPESRREWQQACQLGENDASQRAGDKGNGQQGIVIREPVDTQSTDSQYFAHKQVIQIEDQVPGDSLPYIPAGERRKRHE